MFSDQTSDKAHDKQGDTLNTKMQAILHPPYPLLGTVYNTLKGVVLRFYGKKSAGKLLNKDIFPNLKKSYKLSPFYEMYSVYRVF